VLQDGSSVSCTERLVVRKRVRGFAEVNGRHAARQSRRPPTPLGPGIVQRYQTSEVMAPTTSPPAPCQDGVCRNEDITVNMSVAESSNLHMDRVEAHTR